MRELIRRSPLASYFVLAYALSWAYWIPLFVLGVRVAPGSSTTHFPGLLGPAIAACLVEAACRGSGGVLALLRRCIQVSRPRGIFWLYALSPVGFLALALLVIAVSGRPLPGFGDFARFSGLPELGLPAVVLIVFLAGGYGEEIGWRGFALARMQQRFGPGRGAVLLGLLWAGWHVPAFGVIETYREMTIPMILGGFVFGIVSGSIVLARVACVTRGSIFAAALWHTTYNMTSATSAGGGLIAAATSTCVMVWAIVLVVREWRQRGSASLLATPV